MRKVSVRRASVKEKSRERGMEELKCATHESELWAREVGMKRARVKEKSRVHEMEELERARHVNANGEI